MKPGKSNMPTKKKVINPKKLSDIDKLRQENEKLKKENYLLKKWQLNRPALTKHFFV